MDNNQFQLLMGSLTALQTQVAKLDAKLDAVNVETARQGVKIAQLEQTTAHQKTFLSTLVATAIAGALAAWAVPSLTEKTSDIMLPKQRAISLVVSTSRENDI